MKIWLVTTGSSDVQLKTDDDWNEWYRAIKSDCYNLPIKPIRAVENEDEPYRIAPRVLGMAYQAYPDEVWDTLEFPLLKEFTAKLQGEAIAQIFLLLTDQSQIFDETQRDDLKCPYWQDTYELLPIFERYFQIHFPDTELVPLKISPNLGETGLDDWNAVLDLVRSKLKEISVDPNTVYVSHQAGTPAISSAVQFSSLARFRNDVQFLVSNEYDRQIYPIPRSTYLRGIELQEAKALLDRYDYSGVEQLLATVLSGSHPVEKRIKKLLEAAIAWNFAEFYKFKNKLSKIPDFAQEPFPWWRLGYEAAYLGIIRLRQGNTTDAMFHSFRAVEGSLYRWVKDYHASTIATTPHPYRNRNLYSYGKDLYLFLKTRRTITEQGTPDIYIFGEFVFDQRNELFHQLIGLQDKKEVFRKWQALQEKKWEDDDEDRWKTRILNCLNFIAQDDLPKPFESLEAASLMVKVHQELATAIAAL